MASERDAPTVHLLHVTTDHDGHTVTHRCQVPGLTMRRTIGASPPLWATEPNPDPVSRSIWVLPAGWRGGWHTNPQRQLVVPLSGRWWVRTQDGTLTVMGPGDAHLGDDVDAISNDAGNIGHDSGVDGDEPVVLLMVPIGGEQQPCVGVEECPGSI
ncbi:MAG: hypothetical protein R2698_15045 [Microthrixaceae bacterium]